MHGSRYEHAVIHVYGDLAVTICIGDQLDRCQHPPDMVPVAMREDRCVNISETQTKPLAVSFDRIAFRAAIKQDRMRFAVERSLDHQGKTPLRTTQAPSGQLGRTGSHNVGNLASYTFWKRGKKITDIVEKNKNFTAVHFFE
ncbi:hypothetical protein BKK79_02800 [Cupriavidus sp. USMAA2-4]|uniref:Uncharacterized protein n=1 Tax=Cupriavidus malaysiensis TaxID=367825 RepID=A0ABM6F411_9BURK|nr:hypothetical protein BKK79_02800 [Cupriavidus sp. USMAA2-4]AOZ06184.1 hypothetical protein BKK80_10310 [Cupriavidus malaysiensis]